MMKKPILIVANEMEQSQELEQELIEKVEASTLEFAKPHTAPDYIITIGGDGTLLSAFHHYQEYLDKSHFIGIHTGHLGFYTDWRPHELDELIHELEQSDGTSISYPLIAIELTDTNDRKLELLALNECTFRSRTGTLVIDVSINDYFLETFRGDGLCLSTPTGSTGLNKSLGGAIIHPRVEALQLTEMAGINNRVYRSVTSPMIVPNDEWIELEFDRSKGKPLIQVDHLYFDHIDLKSVRAQVAKESIHFARFRHTHFWDRVENAFLGNKQDYTIKKL